MLATRIPVETMEIDSGTNAGLLPVRILASGNPHLIQYGMSFEGIREKRYEECKF